MANALSLHPKFMSTPLCIVSPTPSVFDIVMSNDLLSIPPPVIPCSAALWLHPLFDILFTTPSLFDITMASIDLQMAWHAFLHTLLPYSAAPLLCFTHLPSFDVQMIFPPHLIHSPTPSPFDVAKWCSNDQGCIPPPLPSHYDALLLCFMHLPLFNVPMTFSPPLLCFAHPIPVWCWYGVRWGSNDLTHIPPPPAGSFYCSSALFHPPVFVQCSNNLSTPSDLFCPPHPCLMSPNDVQMAGMHSTTLYCLVLLPLCFISPTFLCSTFQQSFHPPLICFTHHISVWHHQTMFKWPHTKYGKLCIFRYRNGNKIRKKKNGWCGDVAELFSVARAWLGLAEPCELDQK